MGIRNSLLGVGSVGITTETGIIIGAAVVKIFLVVLCIAWYPDRMLAAAGILISRSANRHYGRPHSRELYEDRDFLRGPAPHTEQKNAGPTPPITPIAAFLTAKPVPRYEPGRGALQPYQRTRTRRAGGLSPRCAEATARRAGLSPLLCEAPISRRPVCLLRHTFPPIGSSVLRGLS